MVGIADSTLRGAWAQVGLAGVLASLALGVSGCEERVDYATRWRVVPRADAEPTPTDQSRIMTNPVVCSDAGISVVDTLIIDEFGFLVAEERRPCFPTRFSNPDHLIHGVDLPPGEYDLLLIGLGSNGAGWGLGLDEVEPEEENAPVDLCPGSGSDQRCPDEVLVCDCRAIEIVEGETTVVDDLVLLPPPECLNGIDEDGDGLVDALDPGCIAEGSESAPVASAGLVFEFSLLSGNEAAKCAGLGVGSFRIELDDVVVAEPTCLEGAFAISLGIGIGTHTISVVATSPAGEVLTHPQTFEVEVSETGRISTPELKVDFSDVDFLEPIIAVTGFTPEFRLDEGTTRTCAADPQAPGRTLDLPTLRATLLDAAGEPVQPSPLLVSAGMEVGRANGSDLDCFVAGARTLDTLQWGQYQLVLEAVSAEGEVCFTNREEPHLLAPGPDNERVDVPRVVPPPTSCIECGEGGQSDCGPLHSCVDGVCLAN